MNVTEKTARKRLLIVDDDVQLLDTLAIVLSRKGFEPVKYTTAGEAMSAVIQDRFDVILSDISMPGLSGLEFIRLIRKVDLDVPIVLMTGVPSKESAIKAVEYGAYRYLEKPVEPGELVKVLGQACSVHNLARLRREANLSGPLTLQLGQRSALEVRFQQALECLWLTLQPIINTREGTPIGYEAFVRSNERTLPMPRDLLDAASRLQQTHELGRGVRALAAQVAQALPEERLLFVNVSAAELNDNELLAPSSPLSGTASRVVLEITERESLDQVAGLNTRLARLRSLGYRIALDGVGSGYADLAGFSRVEPDFVKLSGDIIRKIDASGRRKSLVGGMVRILSTDLGMMVVGTSVETTGESAALQEAEVSLQQGHLFGDYLSSEVVLT